MTTRHERRLWAGAQNLADLGCLMARWLAGDLQTRPGYYGSTDLDTPELTELCIHLCRTGFVTTDSQRAVFTVNRDGETVLSRAAVSGFCDDAIVARLLAAAWESGVSVMAQRAGHPVVNSSVVVTEVNGEPYYLAGGYPSYDDLIAAWADIWRREEAPGLQLGIGHRAFESVQAAWYVAVIDPKWGRNDRLINMLTSSYRGDGCSDGN